MSNSSYAEKRQALMAHFADCQTDEAKYQKIIELGRQLPHLCHTLKVSDNLVKGCQSSMYLSSRIDEGVVYFEAESDALISSGLVALLLKVYSGETPETILKTPPSYLEELGIASSLTPNRASGLYSIHLRMKQDALRYLVPCKEVPPGNVEKNCC